MKRSDLVNTMTSFIGTKEVPDGSNLTPIGKEFGWNGVAWCAETVSVACKRLGFPLHEAAVINIEKHAKAGDWGMGWSSVPVVGAASIFDFGRKGNPADMHTGIVSVALSTSRFWNVEGNYQNRCDRVLRDTKFVRGFATFPFEPENQEIHPKMNITLPPGVSMLDFLKNPDGGGVVLLLSDGGILAFGTDFDGNVLGKDYMKPDHKPVGLKLNPKHAQDPNKPWYLIVDQHGDVYGDDGF